MLNASLYIVACTAKNRLVVRLRRLREPRYLIGAVAGAAYFYFAVFRRTGGARPRRGRSSFSPAALLSAYGGAAVFAGAGLFLMAALAWIVPADSALLSFSEAETNLLLPAPVTRRQLLVHRLLRSQLPLLFGAVVSAVFVPMAAGQRLRFGAGMFVLLVTARVYFTGVTRARARLAARSVAERSTAWAPLVLLLSAAAIVSLSVVRVHLRVPADTVEGFLSVIGQAIRTGPSAVVLWPFTAVVRPLFTGSNGEFLLRLPAALVVLLCTIEWVLLSDSVFREVSNVPEPTLGGRRSAKITRARNVGWTLRLSGRMDTVFLWKNAMQTLRGTSLISVIPLAAPAIVFAVGSATARMSATDARAPAAALAMGSLFLAGVVALLGPQIVRSDLRGDLRHLDVIKTWPMKSAAVIRGQLLWPTLSLTLSVWFALGCATVFSAAAFPRVTAIVRLSSSAAAFVLAPALVAAQLTVHNAVAVLFPAWVPVGSQRARGFDVLGQRLILLAGVILVLAVMVGPGAIAGVLIAIAFYGIAGAVSVVPAAAVCVVIVAAEIGLVTQMLGTAYDRIDLPQIERPD